MVKIAIVGGSGNVGQEIIDALLAANKHEILLLSRKDAPAVSTTPGVTWVKADYEDPKQLAKILQGVHTLLSLMATQDERAFNQQKNLIDAAIEAGVKRFAPSEWSTSGFDHLSWYEYKAHTRQYLTELNKDKKVLEYSLFHPGLFLNYLTSPYESSKHLHMMEVPFDFNNRRFIIREGSENDSFTLTTIQDLANVVAKAVDFEGEWPVVSGIRGADITVAQLIALGEKIRGGPFEIEKVEAEDFKNGTWKTTWVPTLDHPSIPPELVEPASRMVVAGMLLAISAKAYSCSDEWNQLLPDYKFTQPEKFLTEFWHDKP